MSLLQETFSSLPKALHSVRSLETTETDFSQAFRAAGLLIKSVPKQLVLPAPFAVLPIFSPFVHGRAKA